MPQPPHDVSFQYASPNPFSALIGEAAKAAVAIKGMADITSAFSKAGDAVLNLLVGQIGKAFSLLVSGAAAAAKGLIELGAAALPGGFTVLSQTVSYLGAVIGSVATPVFVVFAAALVTVANLLKDNMAVATQWVIDKFKGLREAADETASTWRSVTKFIGALFGNEKDLADIMQNRGKDVVGAKQQAMNDKLWATFTGALGDVLKGLRQAQSQQARFGFSSLTDAWKNVQMASFTSPLERQIALLQDSLLNIIQKGIQEIGRIAPIRP